MLLDTCVLAHCIFWVLLFCTFFSLVGFPISPWIASCLPGCATALSFTMMAANNDQHKAHTHTHTHTHTPPARTLWKCSQCRGRICSTVITGNNTTLGTNCYTILRPLAELAGAAVCITCSKKKKKERKKRQAGNLLHLINDKYHERKLTVALN